MLELLERSLNRFEAALFTGFVDDTESGGLPEGVSGGLEGRMCLFRAVRMTKGREGGEQDAGIISETAKGVVFDRSPWVFPSRKTR